MVLAGWITKRAGVADVGEVAAQLQRLDECLPTGAPADDTEREHRSRPEGQVLEGAFVVRMVGQSRPTAPTTLQGFGTARRRRLRALERWASIRWGSVSTPCISRNALNGDSVGPTSRSCSARSLVQNANSPKLPHHDRSPYDAHRLGHAREVAVAPVEAAGLDHDTAQRCAVTAEELRGRMHDDVGAPLHRPAHVRRRHGRVDDQRDSGRVGHLGEALEIGDDT